MALADNHFQLFGLAAEFDLDQDALARRYREWQRSLHPDNYAQAGEQDRRLAAQRAAQLNEAFSILKNPLSRARYLLELQGIPAQDGITSDHDFLLQQLELREQLETIRHNADPDALADFLADVESSIRSLTNTLAADLRNSHWQAAADKVLKLQFFNRLQEEAVALEERLG